MNDGGSVPRARFLRERAARLEAETIAERTTRSLYETVKAHERSEQELRLLHAMSLAINTASHLDEAIGSALRLLAAATGWTLGQAWLPRRDGTLTCAREYVGGPAMAPFHEASRAVVMTPGVGLVGQVWASKVRQWCRGAPAPTLLSPRQDVAAALGFQDAVVVPVLAGDDVVAVLEFFLATQDTNGARHVELLTTVAAQIGSFVQAKRVDDAFRESASLATTLDSIGDALITTDLDGRVVRMNPVAERQTGLDLAAALGQPLDDVLQLFEELSGTRYLNPWREVVRAGSVVSAPDRVAIVSREGVKHSVVDSAAPLRDRNARITGCIVVLRDVTEARKLESRLALAERLVSVGTLAAGVAHEINNPLAYVLGNLEYAHEAIVRIATEVPRKELDEIAAAMREARQGAERVRHIVRDLKTFSRADEDTREPLALPPLVESALNMAWNEIRHRARLTTAFGDAPLVDVNAARLGQVLVNLLVNAAHAIPEGQAEHDEIRVVTSTAADGHAIIEISDTGSGIAPNVLPYIFDPFYTTKSIGAGTGLGLSICQGIITSLGGEITVESELGRGSCFRIALPPAARQPSPPQPQPPPTVPPPVAIKRARVLVIDDEPIILRTVSRVLKEHTVEAVASAPEALARIAEDATYDLILCDLMMPEMTGIEFHAELARVAPALLDRVVFATGGAFTASARDFLDRPDIRQLDKPIDFKQLRGLISRLLR